MPCCPWARTTDHGKGQVIVGGIKSTTRTETLQILVTPSALEAEKGTRIVPTIGRTVTTDDSTMLPLAVSVTRTLTTTGKLTSSTCTVRVEQFTNTGDVEGGEAVDRSERLEEEEEEVAAVLVDIVFTPPSPLSSPLPLPLPLSSSVGVNEVVKVDGLVVVVVLM